MKTDSLVLVTNGVAETVGQTGVAYGQGGAKLERLAQFDYKGQEAAYDARTYPADTSKR